MLTWQKAWFMPDPAGLEVYVVVVRMDFSVAWIRPRPDAAEFHGFEVSLFVLRFRLLSLERASSTSASKLFCGRQPVPPGYPILGARSHTGAQHSLEDAEFLKQFTDEAVSFYPADPETRCCDVRNTFTRAAQGVCSDAPNRDGAFCRDVGEIVAQWDRREKASHFFCQRSSLLTNSVIESRILSNYRRGFPLDSPQGHIWRDGGHGTMFARSVRGLPATHRQDYYSAIMRKTCVYLPYHDSVSGCCFRSS